MNFIILPNQALWNCPLWKTIAAKKTCLDVYIVAVHHLAPRVKEVSINLCGLLSDYTVHVAKQFSKNLE